MCDHPNSDIFLQLYHIGYEIVAARLQFCKSNRGFFLLTLLPAFAVLSPPLVNRRCLLLSSGHVGLLLAKADSSDC